MARRLVAVSLMGIHSCQARAAFTLRCGNASSALITDIESARVSILYAMCKLDSQL